MSALPLTGFCHNFKPAEHPAAAQSSADGQLLMLSEKRKITKITLKIHKRPRVTAAEALADIIERALTATSSVPSNGCQSLFDRTNSVETNYICSMCKVSNNHKRGRLCSSCRLFFHLTCVRLGKS